MFTVIAEQLTPTYDRKIYLVSFLFFLSLLEGSVGNVLQAFQCVLTKDCI